MSQPNRALSNEERRDNLKIIGRAKDAEKVDEITGMEVYWRAIYATHVKRLRNQLGLTQEGFAELCGTSANYISEIERGVCNVTLAMICQIAEATGVHPRWFLEDDPHSPYWDARVDAREVDPICRPWNWDEKFRNILGKLNLPKKNH